MKHDVARLARLKELAELLQQRDLTRLAQSAARCRETEARIAQLMRPVPLDPDPALFKTRQAHLLWAQAERQRLQQTLALQKASHTDHKANAARALGRAQVVARLATSKRVTR